MADAHDECVVDAEPLARILSDYIDRCERDRPPPIARYVGAAADPCYLDPVAWLAQESGVPLKTVRNLTRKTSSGRRAPRYSTTELRIADALVCAIGMPGALSPGGPLQPRGRSPKHDGACCGGSSLNGSLT